MVRGHERVSIATASLRVAATLVFAGLIVTGARAAPPAHPAGTLCYTPRGYCIARPQGPVGSPCVCQGSAGPLSGVRG
jgi:hypothetical protein